MAIVLRFLVINLDTNEVMATIPATYKDARKLASELAVNGGRFQAFSSAGGVFKSVTNVVEHDE